MLIGVQAADQLGGNLLGGAGEEGLREGLRDWWLWEWLEEQGQNFNAYILLIE